MIDSLILGIIQGLTEFLPVSSSGHLTILHSFLGEVGDNVLFDVFLHFGTLLATLVFFRHKIFSILKGLLSEYKSGDIFKGEWSKRSLYICIAVIPTGIIGLVFKDELEALFLDPKKAALMLLVTGAILLLTLIFKGKEKTAANIGILGALIVGIVQGLAIIPGISRSGSTISASLFLGLRREEAGEYSFLISIPAIFGALLIKLKDIESLVDVTWFPMILGLAVSFFVGLLALSVLLKFVRKGRFWVFAPYCIILGLIGSIFMF